MKLIAFTSTHKLHILSGSILPGKKGGVHVAATTVEKPLIFYHFVDVSSVALEFVFKEDIACY